jgi:hypothetical protein
MTSQKTKPKMKNLLPRIIALAMAACLALPMAAQDNRIPVRDDASPVKPPALVHNMDFGVGFGLDYGGLFGIQVGFAPVKHLTLFAAAGYYVYQLGWQAGIKGLLKPKTTDNVFRPFAKIMYGTNSIIMVEGIDDYNEVYRGATVGFGIEFRFGSRKANGFDVDLNVPLRTPDYWSDYNQLKNDPRVSITQDQIPIAFSVGYHFEF